MLVSIFLSPQAAFAEPLSAKFATGGMQNFIIRDAPSPIGAASFFNGDGEKIGFDAFTGKTVMVNLWATWCGPCRREMPSIDRMAQQLQGPDFAVVAISVDRNGAQKARDFLQEINVANLDFYIDPTARIGSAFRSFGLPLTVILDAGQQELGRLVGPAEWDSPEALALLRAAVALNRPGG